jgi:NAD(P)-dependent dehydrogenase (short-subunit alcohol dehydrogenase family)
MTADIQASPAERRDVAVVTGASSPLGRALTEALARRGVAVAGIARVPGAPTILINGAEVYPHRDILEETPETFLDTVQTNLGGVFACCHAALPQMVIAARGRIINIVTFADVQPAPLAAAYSVSKGAVRILTRALVADLGDRFPDIVITDWVPGTHKPRKGIPDGVDPQLAGEWGANLALMQDRALNGRVFLQDHEYLPHKSLKGRVKDRVLGRGRVRVRL